jgi:hypothetical protein
MDRKRGFYFGCHASMWRIRAWNAVFWVFGMCCIVLLYLGGMLGGIANVYIGTVVCWIASFIFKETSLTATCLVSTSFLCHSLPLLNTHSDWCTPKVGTALSIWQGGDILSKYWRIQMGNID